MEQISLSQQCPNTDADLEKSPMDSFVIHFLTPGERGDATFFTALTLERPALVPCPSVPLHLYALRHCTSTLIIRPHRHTRRCGILLQMSHVAWSVCLCVDHTDTPCENSWTDRDAVWALTQVGQRNHVSHLVDIPPREGEILGVIRPSEKALEVAATE